jgi:tricorn protease
MSSSGYFRFPAIKDDTVYFVSEDDLWSVPASGGRASRLTSGLGASLQPAPSPDGKLIAFSSSEEGISEVYVMPASGGQPRRVNYSAHPSLVVGWTPSNHAFP